VRRIRFEAELPPEQPSFLDSLFFGPLHFFDFVVIGVVLFFAAGLWLVGPPLVYDDFYHMAVAQQIYRLGFIPTWDFWEFVPVGRPHLYPPLLHAVMALVMRVGGGDVLLAARLVKVVTYPLLVLSLWWSARNFAGYNSAFITVLVFIGVLTTLTDGYQIHPATIVLAISCTLFWTFTQKKLVTSILLLTISLWLHIAMPLLIVVVLGVFSALRRDEGYPAFFAKVLISSVLFYSPWLAHVLFNLSWLSNVGTPLGPHIPVLAWVLGLPGLLYSFKYYRHNSFIFALLALALTPMFYSYGHRFWIYILIPLSFYGGITISKFVGSRPGKWKKAKVILIAVVACSAVTFTPAVGHSLEVFIYPPTLLPFMDPSAAVYLALWPEARMGLTPVGFDPTGNIDPIGNTAFYYLAAVWIQVHTQPYQPVCVLGGRAGVDSVMITAFSGRPTANGMWLEVMHPLIHPIVEYYYQYKATIYVVGPPFTSPSASIPTKLVAEFGPVRVFKRI